MIRAAVALPVGLVLLVAGIFAMEVVAILVGAAISGLAGVTLWFGLRRGGPHHFES